MEIRIGASEETAPKLFLVIWYTFSTYKSLLKHDEIIHTERQLYMLQDKVLDERYLSVCTQSKQFMEIIEFINRI